MADEEEAVPEATEEAKTDAPTEGEGGATEAPTTDAPPTDATGAEEEGEEQTKPEKEEGEEEEAESEESSDAGSTDREEKERKEQLMKEYLELLQEIEAQNRIISELKKKICEKCQKGCLTKCEEREIKNLRCCLEKENLKLQCLLKRAITLQEEDPSEVWDEIPITTTFEEDSMPIGLSYNVMKSVCKKSFSDDECCREMNKPKVCQSEVKDSDLDKFLDCLLQKAKKKKPCKKAENICPDDGGTLLEFDDETLKRIMCALQCQTTCGKKDKCKKKDMSKVCKELTRSYSMQEKLVQDNADLEGDRFKLQEEVLSRDRMIECLQQKIQLMQCELQKLCREKQKIVNDSCKSGGEISPRTMDRLKKFKDCAKSLQRNIDGMQSSVERMKLEMNSLKNEREQWEDQVRKEDVCPKRKSKASEIEELKKNYMNLLADYCKKESELKEMKQRTKGFIDPCGRQGGDDIDKAELELLKEKLNDLQDEQEEFKCLIKEQSGQMDDYRNKYLIAQQKVEEQKCIIDKLEMNNKRIEDQINMEIQRIKTKFQDKLKELAQLPKLLENEQLKLANACKEKEDLEQKLRLVCKELKAIKAQLSNSSDGGGDVQKLSEMIRKLENELALVKKQNSELKADKDLICDKLQKTQEDLDCLRTESARIIARTKERAENQRETLQCRIDKLEKELAQCRATACLSISDREEVIKEMKGQLCTLSYSFDSAQKQIKTLKNHICYLSNENAYPVKA